MSVAWYGNAPLPPPSPSHDVTPRSCAPRLHTDYQPRPKTAAKTAAFSQAKREASAGRDAPAKTAAR